MSKHCEVISMNDDTVVTIRLQLGSFKVPDTLNWTSCPDIDEYGPPTKLILKGYGYSSVLIIPSSASLFDFNSTIMVPTQSLKFQGMTIDVNMDPVHHSSMIETGGSLHAIEFHEIYVNVNSLSSSITPAILSVTEGQRLKIVSSFISSSLPIHQIGIQANSTAEIILEKSSFSAFKGPVLSTSKVHNIVVSNVNMSNCLAGQLQSEQDGDALNSVSLLRLDSSPIRAKGPFKLTACSNN
jgi:hypothetical protein